MSVVLVLLLFFSVFYSGYTLAYFLKPSHLVEKIGLSWLIGMQLICFEVFLLLDLTGFLVTRESILILALCNILVSAAIGKIAFKSDPSQLLDTWAEVIISFKKKLRDSKVALALIVFMFIMLTASLISNLYWPIYDWDALALYDFRAKVILETGDIEQGRELGYFYHYPMFTSFLHSFMYVFSFEQAKVWYTSMYAAAILVFYGILRKSLPYNLSIIGTTLLAISPLLFGHSLMAYTNLAYTVYCSLGFIYLTVWLNSKNKYDLLTGALLVALSTLVRTTEPFWITSSVIILVGMFRVRNMRTTVLAITSILIIMYLKEPWGLYVAKQSGSVVTSPINTLQHLNLDSSLSDFINRVTVVGNFFINAVVRPQSRYLIAITFGLAILIKNKMYEKLWDYLPFAVIFLTIAGGTFLFSYLFPEWESIPDSASRMAMILIPIYIYLIIRNPIFLKKKLPSEK